MLFNFEYWEGCARLQDVSNVWSTSTFKAFPFSFVCTQAQDIVDLFEALASHSHDNVIIHWLIVLGGDLWDVLLV